MFHRRKAYPSDINDENWNLIKDLATLPSRKKKKNPKNSGRKPCDPREVWNAINYISETGCRWQDLPHDFECSYSTAFNAFKRLKYSGRLKQIFDRAKKIAVKKNW